MSINGSRDHSVGAVVKVDLRYSVVSRSLSFSFSVSLFSLFLSHLVLAGADSLGKKEREKQNKVQR